MAAFIVQWSNWVAAIETMWLAKLKVFAIWTFIGKKCAEPYSINFQQKQFTFSFLFTLELDCV